MGSIPRRKRHQNSQTRSNSHGGRIVAGVIEHGISRNLIIVSDDAGQFNVLLHALCWIHAERSINKITPVSLKGKEQLEDMRGKLWELYAGLKAYKASPDPIEAERPDQRFDEIFTTKTDSALLTQQSPQSNLQQQGRASVGAPTSGNPLA
jgi:hypothetical protein